MTTGQTAGRFVTFYSYKGGTGRSMALANMAWLLAQAGRTVLAIDWDLEAPGLHRYFHPFLSDPELTSSEGLIDFAIRFVEEASAKELGQNLAPDWFVPYANIGPYVRTLDYLFPNGGALDFLGAGRQGPGYAGRVNSFNWKHFYEKLGGWSVIEEMRKQLARDYDYILIDSRTGVSDTAGICTVQLPDDVVICFTLNYQSVDGAASAATSILEQRLKIGKPVRVLPVPMRVLDAEKFKLEAVSAYAQARFLQLLPLDVTNAATREKYWQEVLIPHVAFYGFEEQLAWFLEPATQVAGVLGSIKRLGHHLTGVDFTDLPGPEPEERAAELARFAAVWTRPIDQPIQSVMVPVSSSAATAVVSKMTMETRGELRDRTRANLQHRFRLRNVAILAGALILLLLGTIYASAVLRKSNSKSSPGPLAPSDGLEQIRSAFLKRQQGDLPAAIAILSQGVRIAKDPGITRQIYRDRAFCNKLAGDWEASIVDLTSALAIDDGLGIVERTDLMKDRSVAYCQVGDLDLALQDYTSLAALGGQFEVARKAIKYILTPRDRLPQMVPVFVFTEVGAQGQNDWRKLPPQVQKLVPRFTNFLNLAFWWYRIPSPQLRYTDEQDAALAARVADALRESHFSVAGPILLSQAVKRGRRIEVWFPRETSALRTQ